LPILEAAEEVLVAITLITQVLALTVLLLFVIYLKEIK
jgi:hypothetical protein